MLPAYYNSKVAYTYRKWAKFSRLAADLTRDMRLFCRVCMYYVRGHISRRGESCAQLLNLCGCDLDLTKVQLTRLMKAQLEHYTELVYTTHRGEATPCRVIVVVIEEC